MPKPTCELPVELGLQRAERSGGDLVDLGEHREQTRFVELAGRERQREVVAVPERLGGPVAKMDQRAQVGGDLGADGLGRVPGRGAVLGIVARPEHLEDVVVVDLDPVDDAAMPGEPRLDVGLELHDLPPDVGVDLVRGEALLEELELAGDQGIEAGLGACGADVGERVGIGQRVGQRDLGLGPPALGLLPRVDVGFPPARVGCRLERSQRGGARRDEIGGVHLNQMRW